MKFKGLLSVLTVTVMLVFVLVASGGLHFAGGAGFGSGSVIIDVTVVGISSQIDAEVDTSISGTGLTAFCQNRGGHIAPGQNTINVNVSVPAQTFTSSSNGNADANYTIDLIAASGISATDAGCPNGNWTVVDLFGTIYVSLDAFSVADSIRTLVDELDYVCTINEGQAFIQCTEL